jgi:hypothetical protein
VPSRWRAKPDTDQLLGQCARRTAAVLAAPTKPPRPISTQPRCSTLADAICGTRAELREKQRSATEAGTGAPSLGSPSAAAATRTHSAAIW